MSVISTVTALRIFFYYRLNVESRVFSAFEYQYIFLILAFIGVGIGIGIDFFLGRTEKLRTNKQADTDKDRERLLPAAIICLSRNGKDHGNLE